jgi:hypothetical protein
MNETAHYLKRASLAWEIMRAVLNAVLLTHACTRPADFRQFIAAHTSLGYWGYAMLLIVIANAFYCLGPLVDIYACVLIGWRLRAARYLLFAAVLAFLIFLIVPWMR